MRYLLIGLAVLVTVGAVCVVSGLALEQSMDEISEKLTLSEARFTAGDLSGALELARTARERWESCRQFFGAALHGEASASAERKLDVLIRLLENNPDAAAEAYSEAIEELQLIGDGERMTLGNLL